MRRPIGARGLGVRLAIGCVALGVLLSACSSSGKSGSGSSGAAGTGGGSAAAGGHEATGSTWTIGAIVTQSGQASSTLAPAKPAMEAWEKWTNAHGGINGHRIKIVFADDQNQPSVGLSEAQQMVQQDHIIAMVGSAANSASAWSSYLEKQGIPIIGGGSTLFLFTKPPYPKNAYNIGPNTASSVAALNAAKQQGGSKLGVIYCAEAAVCQGVVALERQYASKVQGMSVVYGGAVSATAPNYTAACLALKNSGADTVFLGVDNHTLRSMIDQCAQQGFHPIVIGSAGLLQPFWATEPNFAKAVGSLPAFPWWDKSVPAIAEYNQAMKQYDDSGDLAAEANPSTATGAWVAGQAFAAAAKAAKLGDNPTPAQVTKGLNTFKKQTLGGLVGPLTFGPGGDRSGSPCSYLFHIANKSFATLNNGKLYCVSGS